MTPEDIRILYEYNAWGNRRVLEACAALDAEQLTRDLRSSFPSICDTLSHILGAERVWYARWHGHSPPAMPVAGSSGFTELCAEFESVDHDLVNFVSKLQPADLDRVLEYSNLSGKAMSEPLWQTLLQVANHGTYHRGQVTTMFRQLGAKPVQTDLILYFRDRAKGATA